MRPKPAQLVALALMMGLAVLSTLYLTAWEAVPPPDRAGPLPPPFAPNTIDSMPGVNRAPPAPGAPSDVQTHGDRDAPEYGFCPDADVPHPAFSRVPLQSLLSTRASELMDRIQRIHREKRAPGPLRRALMTFLSKQSLGSVELLKSTHGHFDDEFDLAAAAAITLGTQALGHSNLTLAQNASQLATNLAPADSASHVLTALVARRLGDRVKERRALASAYRITPDEPVLALAMGRALSKTPSLDGAIVALSTYLEAEPNDITTGQLRARLRLQQHLHRTMTSTHSGGVTLLYPPKKISSARAQELAQAIETALTEAASLTGLNKRQTLFSVVYQDRADMVASTCVPNWTQGVFDGVLRLHAGTLGNAIRMQRVVRHEAFHAQMGSVPMHAPHWLHEGAAQFFAGEMGPGHMRSYRFMTKHQTHIPFASMDGSFLVIDSSADARLAYHQSLAMVQMMVADGGSTALAQAVNYLRQGGDSHMLWEHMMGHNGNRRALLDHLQDTLVHPP